MGFGAKCRIFFRKTFRWPGFRGGPPQRGPVMGWGDPGVLKKAWCWVPCANSSRFAYQSAQLSTEIAKRNAYTASPRTVCPRVLRAISQSVLGLECQCSCCKDAVVNVPFTYLSWFVADCFFFPQQLNVLPMFVFPSWSKVLTSFFSAKKRPQDYQE